MGYSRVCLFLALTLKYTTGILTGLLVLSSDTWIHHWDTQWFAGSLLWHLYTPLGYSMVSRVSALTPEYTTWILTGLQGINPHTWIHHWDTHWFAGSQPWSSWLPLILQRCYRRWPESHRLSRAEGQTQSSPKPDPRTPVPHPWEHMSLGMAARSMGNFPSGSEQT